MSLQPLHYIDRTNQSFIYEMPLGKPDPNESCRVGEEKRNYVVQSAVKGQQIWYYIFNFLRRRIGKNPCEELKNAREIELIGSQHRKARTALLDSYPTVIQQLNNNEVTQSLMNINRERAVCMLDNWDTCSKYLETPEVLEGGPSIHPFLREFLASNTHDNMYQFFLQNYLEKHSELDTKVLEYFGIDPKQMYNKEMTPENGYLNKKPWKNLSLPERAGFLDYFIRDAFAKAYGLQKASWTPKSTFDAFFEELHQKKAFFVAGAFGKGAHVDAPFPFKQKVRIEPPFASEPKEKEITMHGWKPGAQRHHHSFSGYGILIIGAKKTAKQSYVYYIDAEDCRDPADPASQKIYVMTYDNLIKNVCDLHGRPQPYSPASVGYAYYGDFPSENKKTLSIPIMSNAHKQAIIDYFKDTPYERRFENFNGLMVHKDFPNILVVICDQQVRYFHFEKDVSEFFSGLELNSDCLSETEKTVFDEVKNQLQYEQLISDAQTNTMNEASVIASKIPGYVCAFQVPGILPGKKRMVVNFQDPKKS